MMSTARRRGPFKPAAWRLNRVTRRNNKPGELQHLKLEIYDNPNIRNQRVVELRRGGAKDISKFSFSNDEGSQYALVFGR